MLTCPPIAFLGLAERAARLADTGPGYQRHSFLGLSRTVFSPIFPVAFEAHRLVFATFDLGRHGTQEVEARDPDGKRIFGFKIIPSPMLPPGEAVEFDAQTGHARSDFRGWVPTLVEPNAVAFSVVRPGQYDFVALTESGEVSIGALQAIEVAAPELTPDRIAAIRSNPGGVQYSMFELACNACASRAKFYAGLERSEAIEAEGTVWYRDAPDSFECTCKALKVDLSSIRRNLHVTLLGSPGEVKSGAYTRLYERSTLRATFRAYGQLLAHAPGEEAVQTFIEQHPVLLHEFAPVRLLPKAPILNLFRSDFAILNHRKELILIEIERPDLRLIKKDGGVAAPLQHAIDQVNDWLHVADEHRHAVLAGLRLQPSEVGAIKGMVIAGRTAGVDPEKLRALLKRDFGRVQVMTLDHLGRALDSFIHSVESA